MSSIDLFVPAIYCQLVEVVYQRLWCYDTAKPPRLGTRLGSAHGLSSVHEQRRETLLTSCVHDWPLSRSGTSNSGHDVIMFAQAFTKTSPSRMLYRLLTQVAVVIHGPHRPLNTLWASSIRYDDCSGIVAITCSLQHVASFHSRTNGRKGHHANHLWLHRLRCSHPGTRRVDN